MSRITLKQPLAEFITRQEGMTLLGWDERTWNAALAGGFLPKPAMIDGEEKFYSPTIVERMGIKVQAPRPRPTGTIYFMQSGRFIKIGYTTHLDRRKMSLQTGSPNEIIILHAMPGTRDDEKALHKKFRSDRAEGEWFRSTPRLRVHIIRLQEAAKEAAA